MTAIRPSLAQGVDADKHTIRVSRRPNGAHSPPKHVAAEGLSGILRSGANDSAADFDRLS
jgi:hypothetical protein